MLCPLMADIDRRRVAERKFLGGGWVGRCNSTSEDVHPLRIWMGKSGKSLMRVMFIQPL